MHVSKVITLFMVLMPSMASLNVLMAMEGSSKDLIEQEKSKDYNPFRITFANEEVAQTVLGVKSVPGLTFSGPEILDSSVLQEIIRKSFIGHTSMDFYAGPIYMDPQEKQKKLEEEVEKRIQRIMNEGKTIDIMINTASGNTFGVRTGVVKGHIEEDVLYNSFELSPHSKSDGNGTISLKSSGTFRIACNNEKWARHFGIKQGLRKETFLLNLFDNKMQVALFFKACAASGVVTTESTLHDPNHYNYESMLALIDDFSKKYPKVTDFDTIELKNVDLDSSKTKTVSKEVKTWFGLGSTMHSTSCKYPTFKGTCIATKGSESVVKEFKELDLDFGK